MWEEDPRWQEGHWRLVVGSLEVTVAFAVGVGLIFGIWDPLVSVLTIFGTAIGVLFVAWVMPMWLLGKLIERFARVTAHWRREKDLNHRAN